MKISFKRAFAKDLRKIPQQKREKIEEFIFETAPHAESIQDLAPIVALSGHAGFLPKEIWRLSGRIRVVGRKTDFLSSTAPQRDIQKIPVKSMSIKSLVVISVRSSLAHSMPQLCVVGK